MIEILNPSRLKLPDGVVAVFTTRTGGVSEGAFEALNLGFSIGDNPVHVRTNRENLFATLGIDDSELAKPHQTHSANIGMVEQPGEFSNTDALITHEPNIFLSVQTADCLPILIWSIDGEWLGAIHSGWRGTEQGIVPNTMSLLLSATGYQPDEYFVCVGPGLGRCHFEVGQEFETKFEPKYLEHRDGLIYFDNTQVILDQILGLGIPRENIEIIEECTYCEADKYFSHRRDSGQTGRMMALIGRRQ